MLLISGLFSFEQQFIDSSFFHFWLPIFPYLHPAGGRARESRILCGRFCRQCLEVMHIVSIHLIHQNSLAWPHPLARETVVPRTWGNRRGEELASLCHTCHLIYQDFLYRYNREICVVVAQRWTESWAQKLTHTCMESLYRTVTASQIGGVLYNMWCWAHWPSVWEAV